MGKKSTREEFEKGVKSSDKPFNGRLSSESQLKLLSFAIRQFSEGIAVVDSQKEIIEIIRGNIRELTQSFSLKLSSKYFALTPTEIQVADLIKHGKKTKEIASTLYSSYKTIETHRENIRKKLGISKQSVNLRSFLLSLK